MFVYNLNTMKTHNEERNAAKNFDTHLFRKLFGTFISWHG